MQFRLRSCVPSVVFPQRVFWKLVERIFTFIDLLEAKISFSLYPAVYAHQSGSESTRRVAFTPIVFVVDVFVVFFQKKLSK
jgi:hypothetical protein